MPRRRKVTFVPETEQVVGVEVLHVRASRQRERVVPCGRRAAVCLCDNCDAPRAKGLGNGQRLVGDRVQAMVSYNILDDQYATVAAQADAEERAIREAAGREHIAIHAMEPIAASLEDVFASLTGEMR